MEEQKPKVPKEAVDLYNVFIHGGMSRRDFIDGIAKLAIGGFTTAMLVDALMPNYAQGQQVARNDDRIKATYETVPSPNRDMVGGLGDEHAWRRIGLDDEDGVWPAGSDLCSKLGHSDGELRRAI